MIINSLELRGTFVKVTLPFPRSLRRRSFLFVLQHTSKVKGRRYFHCRRRLHLVSREKCLCRQCQGTNHRHNMHCSTSRIEIFGSLVAYHEHQTRTCLSMGWQRRTKTAGFVSASVNIWQRISIICVNKTLCCCTVALVDNFIATKFKRDTYMILVGIYENISRRTNYTNGIGVNFTDFSEIWILAIVTLSLSIFCEGHIIFVVISVIFFIQPWPYLFQRSLNSI